MEGIIAQKIFRYKYREANYSPEDHYRKENRMISSINYDHILQKY